MTITALNPVLTTQGLAKAFKADGTGIALTVSHIAFGTSGYTPVGAETALASEIVRVPVASGKYVGDHVVEIAALLDHDAGFWVRELGFYLDDGTLFAVWSDPTVALAYFTPGVPLAVAYLLALEALPAGAITFTGDVDLHLTFAAEFAKISMALARNTRVIEADALRIKTLENEVKALRSVVVALADRSR
ncbi:phage tail protein [Roseibium litorale]|uniref:Phage tail protein n=1 Tax=Roseibium litorale TaxID=2803841 RepID=A0ABR9CJ89_9HYPH|nr:phage tail protein [Roseibium litorale]MBD8890895.1 phage tail protein [Roseibium litorale]